MELAENTTIHLIQYPFTIDETWQSDEKLFVMYANMLHKLRELCPETNIRMAPQPFGTSCMGNVFRFVAVKDERFHWTEISLRIPSYKAYMLRPENKKVADNLQELVDFLTTFYSN